MLFCSYIHAYQSAIWNFAASTRLASLGKTAAVEGDLVVADAAALLVQDDPGTAAPVVANAAPEAVKAAAGGGGGKGAGDYRGLPEVHVVTAAEAANGTYGLEQVVLPLPGYAVTYPTNAIGAEYTKLLAADGVRFLLQSLAPPGDYCSELSNDH